jgi:imidazole glycerol-phosphate synthase subunit HisF
LKLRKRKPRILPSLLIDGGGLYKTVRFKDPKYIGDPINAVKIFNDSEVDELIILDISAGEKGPDLEKIARLTDECFMPICYGGGIRTLSQAESLFALGVEKVCVNSVLKTNPSLITQISKQYGAQSIVVSLDVKKNWLRKYSVFVNRGTEPLKLSPVEAAKWVQDLGAGEIVLHNVDKEGTFEGYDYELIEQVAKSVEIPVVALGGASKISDFSQAVKSGAAACAAGSLFVFHGPLRAVLINYPTQNKLKDLFADQT